MKIMQLGNGGGLDFNQTNSAFLIKMTNDDYCLVDCGFNIMQKLKQVEDEDDNFEIKKIKVVLITHNHADHTGNLETLIFYNYFINNKVMKVFLPKEILELYKGINKVYEGSTMVNKQIVDLKEVWYTDKIYNIFNNVEMKCLQVEHKAELTYGYVIYTNDVNGTSFFISGDTKATPRIEEFVNNFKSKSSRKMLVFHDFSNWNAPSKQVHCCESDFEAEYSDEFKKDVIKYHNGMDFNGNWQ